MSRPLPNQDRRREERDRINELHICPVGEQNSNRGNNGDTERKEVMSKSSERLGLPQGIKQRFCSQLWIAGLQMVDLWEED